MKNNIIWVLISTTSRKEAQAIGRAALQQRLCACFGLHPKLESTYFWPPKTGRLETSRGPLLVLETLPKHYASIGRLVHRLHSDRVPFIGKILVSDVDAAFYNWLKNEVK